MAFARHANLATAYSNANGSSPTRAASNRSKEPKLWTNQGKPNYRLHLQQHHQEGLSRYDPVPSFYELGTELQVLCEAGQLDMAIDVLLRMDQLGYAPSNNIYWSLLKTCKKQKAVHHVMRVHSHMGSHALDPNNSVLAEFLISTLVSCHALDHALQVFHMLPHRTVFSWTALISGYVECGNGHEALKLYDLMLEKGIQADEYTCVSLLKACSSTFNLEKGKAIHDHARKNGFESNAFVGSTLVTMYSKCGSIADAEDVFCALPHRSFVAWTTMLASYVEHGQGMKALQLYRQMREECLISDERTFVIALQACCMLAEKEKGVVDGEQGFCKVMSLKIGQALHADAWRKGFDSNIYVSSSLICMYGKCGNISTAENVFCGSSQCDVVPWNAMLSAYVEQGQPKKALQLYKLMHEEGQSPAERTFVITLQACSTYAEGEEAVFLEEHLTKAKSLEIGQALHTDALRKGFDLNAFISSALLNMYGKCGSVIEAKNLFGGLSQRSIVSWNAMLSAYVEQGQSDKALQLYKQMQVEGVEHDDITLICLLQISGQTGSIEICRRTHIDIVFGGFDLRPLVAINLIYAFGNCASMVDAQAVFNALPLSNVVPWNALIAGYARGGDCEASFYYFKKMQQVGVKPDGGTFLSLLAACSYVGLVKEGTEYFESMSKDHGITPEVKHYEIMVDLLGHAGEFTKVEDMVSRMPMQPNVSLWLCLLEVCAKCGNVKLGKRAFDSAVHLQPKEAAAYLLMSNIYASVGLRHLANEVENSRQKEGACKKPGVSWIELEQELVSFVAEDCKNSLQQQWLYDFLQELSGQLRAEEEVPCLEYMLSGLAVDKEKDWSLCGHSQKLALAFGLLNPPLREPIRVRKNTCICRDCHELTKLISHVKHKDILVIDDKRVHHFKCGKCSCRDYFSAFSRSLECLDI